MDLESMQISYYCRLLIKNKHRNYKLWFKDSNMMIANLIVRSSKRYES